MDVIVSLEDDGKTWRLVDLLGRSMGCIEEVSPSEFMICPAGEARKTMLQVNYGPHSTLDDALAEIERRTRGVCRREPGQDGA